MAKRSTDAISAEFGYQFRYGDPRAAEKLMVRVLDASDAQLASYHDVILARLGFLLLPESLWQCATGTNQAKDQAATGISSRSAFSGKLMTSTPC